MAAWMPAAELLNACGGLLYLTVGAYFLAFRPVDRRALWFGLAAVLFGVGGIGSLWTDAALLIPWTAAIGAFLVFAFLYPRRIRWASAAGVMWVLAAATWVATIVYYVMDPNPFTHELDLKVRMLYPSALGTAMTLVLLVLGRLLDLRDPEIPARERQAAPYLFLFLVAGVITGGGFELGHVLGGLLERTDFPTFFYETPAGVGYTVAGVLTWWVFPGMLSLYCLLTLRTWLPAGLMVAGLVSYVPILIQPNLDIDVVVVLRIWGFLLSPALAMYAQARWAPFEGEPTRAGTGWAMAVVSGLLAYAFILVTTSAVAPKSELGAILGPILGLAAAIGMAALVLPRARKMHLQRVLALAAQDRFSPGSVVLGRYRIVGMLGAGGQGRVYEATDRKHRNARVVLKAVTSDDAVHEARILKGLIHPNIVRCVDVVEVPGFTLLVLEFADGGTLRGLLSRNRGRLPAADAQAVVEGILSGLSEAHSKGVAHRDIKPENILLSAGIPKLADFGVAHHATPGSTIRTDGRGTLAYLAPEQVRGEAGDMRSDVYAAGVLVHEVLTGKTPVPLPADDFLMRQAILTTPPKLSLAPGHRGVAAVLRRALSKDPSARYANAGEFHAHLKAAWRT